MQDRIIAVNSNCYHGYPIEEAIRGISEAGFRYIELTATKGWTEHVFPDQSFRSLLRVQDLLERYKLIPFATSGHTNLMDEERLPDFIDNIRLAHFFGSRYIVTSIGEAHLKDRAEAADKTVAEHIRTLLPCLEKYDMILALEVHGEHGTGARIKAIADLLDTERVCINYDTANAVFYGGADILQDAEACMNRIGYVHLKDKAGQQKEWNFPALGEGNLPLTAFCRMMDKAGNDSPYSIEIEFTQKGSLNIEEVNAAVRASAAFLQNNGIMQL